jgi:hypothetical protein
LVADKETSEYWQRQAQRQRMLAEKVKPPGSKRDAVERIAARQLARQLREEFTHGIPAKFTDLHKNLLRDAFSEVNWLEIAEDLLAHN